MLRPPGEASRSDVGQHAYEPDSHDAFDKEMTILRHFRDTCANTTGYSAHGGGASACFQEPAYNFPRNRSQLLNLKQIADLSFPTRWANFRLMGFEACHSD